MPYDARQGLLKNSYSDDRKITLKVGRFTSPHFIDRWDCITLNDESVQEEIFKRAETEVAMRAKQVELELLEDATSDLGPKSLRDARPTEFEVLTATAFSIFSEPNTIPCHFAVIECGLGGRLDATNVLPTSAIAVNVITRIGLDHLDMLGGSLRSIVREKCGILRDEVPVVIDGDNSEDVLAMIHEELCERFGINWVQNMVSYAHSTDLQPYLDAKNGRGSQGRHPRLETLLPHQQTNLAIAIRVFAILSNRHATNAKDAKNAELSPSILESVLDGASKSYPARLQQLEPGWLANTPQDHGMWNLNATSVLLDGAHNEQSAAVLREFVDRETTRPVDLSLHQSDEADHYQTTPRQPQSGTKPTIWILALSSTKPPEDILKTLFLDPRTPKPTFPDAPPRPPQANAKIIFTSFTTPDNMPWVKPTSPHTLQSAACSPAIDLGSAILGLTDNIVEALDLVESHLTAVHEHEHEHEHAPTASHEKPLVVIAGSLYLASDMLRFIRDGRTGFLEHFARDRGSD